MPLKGMAYEYIVRPAKKGLPISIHGSRGSVAIPEVSRGMEIRGGPGVFSGNTRFIPNFPGLGQKDRRDIVSATLGKGISPSGATILAKPILSQVVGKTDIRNPVTSAPAVRGRTIPQKEPSIPTIQTKVPQVGLDLGNLLNTGLDLYAKYKTIAAPAPTPVNRSVTQPQTYWPEGYGTDIMAGPTFIANEPTGGIPGFEMIKEPPTEDPKGWVYKKTCGEWKWVKPARRRRRKLLTDSDYNSLLKLQALKVNSNMNIAIAKSIGR